MTACLPDNPAYCFFPHADDDAEPPQIRILVEGFAFAIPTALVALDRADGLAVCDSAQPAARPPRPRLLDRVRRALPARRRRRHERQHPALIRARCRRRRFPPVAAGAACRSSRGASGREVEKRIRRASARLGEREGFPRGRARQPRRRFPPCSVSTATTIPSPRPAARCWNCSASTPARSGTR